MLYIYIYTFSDTGRLPQLGPIYAHYYTEYAGLEIYVFLCIASSFSRQIAIGNAGPTSTLESMGAKRHFHCIFLNIAPIYKQ